MQLISFFKQLGQKQPRWDSYTVPLRTSIETDAKIQAFIQDKAPKLLLIPEEHGSIDTIKARAYVRESGIYAFSEGQTGHYYLCGLRGIESGLEVEKISFLSYCRAYALNQFQFIQDSEEGLREIVKYYADLPESEENQLLDSFRKNKNYEEQMRFITKRKMHDRDDFFAKTIKAECKAIQCAKSTRVGAAFFGAAHLLSGFDTEEDMRITDDRIPDRLIAEGGINRGDYIELNGVHIYVYPKCVQEAKDRSIYSGEEVISVLEHSIQDQKK